MNQEPDRQSTSSNGGNLVEEYLLAIYPDGIVLTSMFWDCECESNYIHPKSVLECTICGALQEEMPYSRANEVLQHCMRLLNEYEVDQFKLATKEKYPYFLELKRGQSLRGIEGFQLGRNYVPILNKSSN